MIKMDGRKGEKSLLLSLGLEQISGWCRGSHTFCFRLLHRPTKYKEIVGYNLLELRTRYKFRELSTYWFTYLAIELIFEI